MAKTLFVLDDPPYGSGRSYHTLRLASSLAKREGKEESSTGEAAVIDPSVSPDVYLELASRQGWSIRYVLETHVHADHLSRARELAVFALGLG